MKGEEQSSGILDSDIKVDSCRGSVSYMRCCQSVFGGIPGNVPSLRNLLGEDVQRPTYCIKSMTRLTFISLMRTHMNLRVGSGVELIVMHFPLVQELLA